FRGNRVRKAQRRRRLEAIRQVFQSRRASSRGRSTGLLRIRCVGRAWRRSDVRGQSGAAA
ncbi:MAG: hypothetical protein ACK56I_05955, partial [bacterium]